MKRVLLYLPILIFLISCETGYKIESNSTQDNGVSFDIEKKPTKSYVEYKEPLEFESFDKNFSGGIDSDNLDIGAIRVSQNQGSTRLVFDIYKWNQTNEYLGKKVNAVGSYNFSYSTPKALITATLEGYRAFSAELPKFNKDSLIEEIYIDEYLNDSGLRFNIKLKYDAKVNVFNLKNPARIVVDITTI